MDKSVLARRKAQQLARDGKIPQAVAEMRRLLTEADPDPYDHVYLGDLLIRTDQTAEALDAWMDAVHSYQRAGLHRNAIAICKKVLRLDAGRTLVHRVLGDLYYLEGLVGEAVPHFLAYLDGVEASDVFGDAFLDAVERASSVVGLQHEAALRLAEHYARAGREDRAASLLRSVAAHLDGTGHADDLAAELARKADEADRAYRTRGAAGRDEAGTGGGDGATEGDSDDQPLENTPPRVPPRDARLIADLEETYQAGTPGGGYLYPSVSEADAAGGPLPAPPDEEAVLLLRLDGTEPDEDEALPEAPSVAPVADEASVAPIESLASAAFAEALSELAAEAGSHEEPEPPSLPILSLDEPEAVGPSDMLLPDAETPVAADATRQEADAFVVEHFPATAWHEETGFAVAAAGERAEEAENASGAAPGATPGDPAAESSLELVETAPGSRRSWVERAEEEYEAGRWPQARRLLERALHEQPLDPAALSRLVEITRLQEDPAGELHYLILLGDAWIEAGVMEEALEVFLKVLRIDPEDSTARRRLARFREMGVPGAERIPEETRNSIAGVLETSGATLAVGAPARAVDSDEWVDLGALLDEFREGVKKQIAGDDWQSHYDLAVSHQGMGLFDEAIEEADAVLAAPELSPEMESQAHELRGLCLMELQRHREAVHEFRTALERKVEDEPRRLSLLYHLGVALESVAEWREAAEIFGELAGETTPFPDVSDRLDRCRAGLPESGAHDRAA